MKLIKKYIYVSAILTLSIFSGYACSKPGSSAVDNGALQNQPEPGWALWTKKSESIFNGQYPLVGDPSIIKDGASYRMFYTCFDAFRSPQGPEICQALSSDGMTWDYALSGNSNLKGRVLATGPKVWDDAHETSFILKYGSSYYLYFVGYVDKGGIFKSVPSAIGLAQSTDGVNFTRLANPILEGTPKGFDADTITSPSIVDVGNGVLLMTYSGFCYQNCNNSVGPSLLGATSTDGVKWTKLPQPLIKSSDIPWPNEGVAETEIKRGPDGFYYLFMTVLQGKNPHQIGLARSGSYYGPWHVNPKPILVSGGPGSFDELEVVAPSVLFEQNKVRMWFHGHSKSSTLSIGYAEAAWPLFNSVEVH